MYLPKKIIHDSSSGILMTSVFFPKKSQGCVILGTDLPTDLGGATAEVDADQALQEPWGPTSFTLWLFNIAMENGPFIDDFPIKTTIYKGFSMAMLNNQMVQILTWINGLRVATYQIDPNISKYTNEYRNLMKFTTYQWACNPSISPATNWSSLALNTLCSLTFVWHNLGGWLRPRQPSVIWSMVPRGWTSASYFGVRISGWLDPLPKVPWTSQST